MIDSNNIGSQSMGKGKSGSANKLLNTEAADQAKTEENSWGYTSVVGDSGDMKGYSEVSSTNVCRWLVGPWQQKHTYR